MREPCLQFPSARSTTSSCVTACPRQGTGLLAACAGVGAVALSPCLSVLPLPLGPFSSLLPQLSLNIGVFFSSSLLSLHSCLLSRGFLIHSGLWKRISSSYLSPGLWTWYLPSFAISRSVGLNQPLPPHGAGPSPLGLSLASSPFSQV